MPAMPADAFSANGVRCLVSKAPTDCLTGRRTQPNIDLLSVCVFVNFGVKRTTVTGSWDVEEKDTRPAHRLR